MNLICKCFYVFLCLLVSGTTQAMGVASGATVSRSVVETLYPRIVESGVELVICKSTSRAPTVCQNLGIVSIEQIKKIRALKQDSLQKIYWSMVLTGILIVPYSGAVGVLKNAEQMYKSYGERMRIVRADLGFTIAERPRYLKALQRLSSVIAIKGPLMFVALLAWEIMAAAEESKIIRLTENIQQGIPTKVTPGTYDLLKELFATYPDDTPSTGLVY